MDAMSLSRSVLSESASVYREMRSRASFSISCHTLYHHHGLLYDCESGIVNNLKYSVPRPPTHTHLVEIRLGALLVLAEESIRVSTIPLLFSNQEPQLVHFLPAMG